MPWDGWWQVPQLRPFAPSGRKKALPVREAVETRPASLWKPTPPDGSGLVPSAGIVAGSVSRRSPGGTAASSAERDAGSGAPRAERNAGPRYGGACAGTGRVSAAWTAGPRTAGPSRTAAVTARLLREPSIGLSPFRSTTRNLHATGER